MRTRNEVLHQRRRAEILTAAGQCFANKGVHRTSMQEICDAAGISAGALYRYFASKDAIILALADEERTANAELIEHLARAEDIVEGLCQALPAIFAVLGDRHYGRLAIEIAAEATRNKEMAALFRRNENELRQALVEALERGQQRGSVEPTLDVQATVFLILSLFDGIPGRSIFTEQAPCGSVVQTLAGFLRKALRSP